MPTKRVIVISDLHSGHLVGLTPPSRHATLAKSASKAQKKLEKVRQELWRLFATLVKQHGPFDVCICGGDTVDGTQKRTQGAELMPGCSDMQEQCDMAAECIKFIRAPQVYMVHGTPYHAGESTDWERYTCAIVRESKYTELAVIKSRLFLDINGCIFDIRHKISGGSLPHTKFTSAAKQALANSLWAEMGVQPKANVFIRGHRHLSAYCGDEEYLSMVVPALQGIGSRYGARQCDFPVKWGFTVFDVEEGGNYSWQFVIPKEANRLQKDEILKA